MGLLLDRWHLARQGEGQIVTVIGEAGIGKSRSIEALQEALAGEPHARINLQCSPYHSDSALYPVIQYLTARPASPRPIRPERGSRSSARCSRSGRPRTQRRFRCWPSCCRSRWRTGAVAADAGSTQGVDAGPHRRRVPSHRRERRSVLIVLEDAHWIDATTLEMMMRLTDSIGRARALAVVTARPDFVPPWLARPHATLLTLGRLGRRIARNWSPALPRRTACRRKPCARSSPRPTAFRCSSKN